MKNLLLTLFILAFAITPIYYLTVTYSIYFKKIYKNKANLKFSYKTESLSTYIPLLILGFITILFIVFIFINRISPLLLIIPVVIDLIVFICIKASCTHFNIYNDYVIVKNNYGLFNEIQSVILQDTLKDNTYELKITTKIDMLICMLVTDDSKKILREIKNCLPKNIKIKEMPTK